MIDRSGQQLGSYRVIRPIGRGGFADVYLGEHVYLRTQVAIKVLQTRVAGEDDLEGFLREARTIAHLVHPHIIRVMDFGVDDQTPFLVMDYAPNGTLRQRYPKGSRVPLPAIVPYVSLLQAIILVHPVEVAVIWPLRVTIRQQARCLAT
jgi:serine/threonine protein kinase